MAEIKANSTIGGLQIASTNDIPSGSVVVRDPLLDFHFTETHDLDTSTTFNTLDDDPNNYWDTTGTVASAGAQNLVFYVQSTFTEDYYQARFYGKIAAIPSSASKTANKNVLIQFFTGYSGASSANMAVRIKVYRGSTIILEKEIPETYRTNFYIPASSVGSGITKIEVLANGDWDISLQRITVRQVDTVGDTDAGTSLLQHVFIQRYPLSSISNHHVPTLSAHNNVSFSPVENAGWNKVTYDPDFQLPSVITTDPSEPFNWGTGQYKPSIPGYYFVETSIHVGSAGCDVSNPLRSAIGAIIKNCDTPANAAAALQYSDWGFSLYNQGQERLSGPTNIPVAMSYGNTYQLPIGPDSSGTSSKHGIVHCSGIVYLDGTNDYVTTWVYSYDNAGTPNLIGSTHETYFLAYLLKGV
jgi:hypothetical protein